MNEHITDNLVRLVTKPKTGSEVFHASRQALGFALHDFWRWSVSDLVSNATRGRLAEFIVASALGISSDVRDEWSPYDLLSPEGLKIEVKSAAYIQSWHWSYPFRYPICNLVSAALVVHFLMHTFIGPPLTGF